MCFYNTFTFECGCESEPPAFLSCCTPARSCRRCSYSECDHHHRRPLQSCHLFIINKDKPIPGKCASHRLQAQMEKRMRELKDKMKHFKDDIAAYQDEIDQEEARRARNQGLKGKYRVHGGHGEHTRRRSVRV